MAKSISYEKTETTSFKITGEYVEGGKIIIADTGEMFDVVDLLDKKFAEHDISISVSEKTKTDLEIDE